MLIATFAAGCFWGVEAQFRQLPVSDTRVGYTGGDTENPDYKSVCTGLTGHAEAIEITYDPDKISYQDLLALFWQIHNPTTLNRQGPDVGSQYRSAIFYHNDEQKALALQSKLELEQRGVFNTPIVTQITPASVFYPAEDYHQRYLEKQGRSFCH
ncbi:peptide-methionine (S)-S-oxide reductase MsrA [methane-oxidizing endosymbiont of Gigantopelta aegis]|uniref:peptide-methionine (S)-S-oxide reductase MsrA n=1 Tax=methane-oxidizing endosymbiont of Gigantopelta aegis TaxID=2794938 RepID=UPI0018DD06F6|nr:peptide-methionine (S)-S-oxide reductase MsrA [methane-oxidizing endosymbiont of Gigantopelta aegis]